MSYSQNCEWCGKPFDGRNNQRFCSRSHKRSALRDRRRREQRSSYLADRATLSGSPTPDQDFTAASERFHQVIGQAAEDKHRAALEREWLAYEKRHGTAHPDRLSDHMQRQAAEHAARAPKFTTPSLAELGAAGRNRAPLHEQHINPPPWPLTEDDPELPSMVDMPQSWRSGRNPLYR